MAIENNKPGDVGEEIIAGLQIFRDALRKGKKIEKEFTVRTVDLNLEPAEYDAEDVLVVRSMLGASQAVFAALLGVSAKTVQSWEQGKQVPKPIARRLLDVIREDPEPWIKKLSEAATHTEPD